MKQLKKYWYIISLLVVTLGLGVVTFLTSQKLTQTKPVAPNVAQEKPKALSAACTVQFSITTPSVTPTGSLTPTVTETVTHTPTPTLTNTPTPTPRSRVGCNFGCTTDADCESNLICASEGLCRNASCTDRTDCLCLNETATPTGTVITATPTTPVLAEVTPTEVPVPQTPVSGSPAVFGLTVAVAGIMLLLLGLVF